jgi:hypothetical protein
MSLQTFFIFWFGGGLEAKSGLEADSTSKIKLYALFWREYLGNRYIKLIYIVSYIYIPYCVI